MEVIGRVGDIVYLDLYGPRIIAAATLEDSFNLEFIDEYSSFYFIELKVYGESPFKESAPVTEYDKLAYSKRIIYDN